MDTEREPSGRGWKMKRLSLERAADALALEVTQQRQLIDRLRQALERCTCDEEMPG